MPNVAYTNRIQLSHLGERPPKPGFLHFGPMQQRDVASVAAIERVSFPTPFPAAVFRQELSDAKSSWWVVRPVGHRPRWRVAPTVSYVGYFLYGECAHVAKIANDPLWRRRGLGEWTLLNMLLAAREEGASYVTLEVRASNTAALQFYFKWGFVQLRRLSNYYEDTGEDGHVLVFAGLGARGVEARLTQEMRQITIYAPEPA
jgi:[ribosomal protein S18]-alanine N-acetyltransferase